VVSFFSCARHGAVGRVKQGAKVKRIQSRSGRLCLGRPEDNSGW
jgi:hypothetical protein